MDIKEVLEFIKKNKDLLDDLRRLTSDIISDAKALVIKNNSDRAATFVEVLKGKEPVAAAGGEDRLRALNAAIQELEREQFETDDTLREMVIHQELGRLLQQRAAVTVAGGFNKVVAFTSEEQEEVERLLQKVQEDIGARQDVKTAIDITVRLLAIGGKIAGKIALA